MSWNLFLKELVVVDEIFDCCVEFMEGFIDVFLVICVIVSDEDVDIFIFIIVDIFIVVIVE